MHPKARVENKFWNYLPFFFTVRQNTSKNPSCGSSFNGSDREQGRFTRKSIRPLCQSIRPMFICRSFSLKKKIISVKKQ